LGRIPSPSPHVSTLHQREDSDVSTGEGSDSGFGTSDEKLSRNGGFNVTEDSLQHQDPFNLNSFTEPRVEVMRAAQAVALHRSQKGKRRKGTRFRDCALDLLSPVGQRQKLRPKAS